MKCALCSTALASGDSPWGVYFDTCHAGNMCGGDTFETRAYLCAECGERLQAQGGLRDEEDSAGDTARTRTINKYRALYPQMYNGRHALTDMTDETLDAIEAYLDRQAH